MEKIRLRIIRKQWRTGLRFGVAKVANRMQTEKELIRVSISISCIECRREVFVMSQIQSL